MPELPAVPRPTSLRAVVADAFSPTGTLAHVVEGYESREGQQLMADAVASILEDGGTLIAEAGTGTGKTLAYLLPAVLSGHRVLVSTGTKNLQEQIYFKDLPALQRALGAPVTATLMKGRSNYLCLHRLEIYRQAADAPRTLSFEPSERPDRSERQVFLPIIDAWASRTEVGDRAELRDLPEDLPLWRDISADAETCLGTECPRYDDCFVTRMRQRAAESDVVIVNHHLLCADASVRQGAYGEVIPSCQTLIVDEAHQLEDVATQYFGVAVSNFRVEGVVRDGTSIVLGGALGKDADEIHRALQRVAERTRGFFAALSVEGGVSGSQRVEFRGRYTADTIGDHRERAMTLAGALEGLEAVLAMAMTPGSAEAGANGSTAVPANAHEATQALQRRSRELHQDLKFLIRASDPDFVYYLESRGRGLVLRAAPIDVSRLIRDALFDRMRTTVLTSATLAVEGSFDYVKGRLGVRHAEHVQVASEFDYERQALLYLPRRMPSPRSPAFAEAVAKETVELLTRSRGRAFVLFTSYSVLRAVQGHVEMSLPFRVLVQGAAPRSVLIDEFRSTPNAVLLATSSFWQGVDVVGETLSCVIVDKLPFASPTEPVTAARIEAIRAAGGDPFADYQVPLAILALQQGLGRLIRHRSDRGVLAVLDPRIRTMGYGQRFQDSLPPAPVTHDLDAVERFFM